MQLPVGFQFAGPAAADQALGLGAAPGCGQQQTCVLDAAAQQQHLAGVVVGGARFGVGVVAVVHDHHLRPAGHLAQAGAERVENARRRGHEPR